MYSNVNTSVRRVYTRPLREGGISQVQLTFIIAIVMIENVPTKLSSEITIERRRRELQRIMRERVRSKIRLFFFFLFSPT